MDGKKSFLIFKDTLSIADDLSDEQLGKLFRAIINYQLGIDQEMDLVTKLAFNTFRPQFDRDNEKWEQKAELNRINGKKGGRPKKPTITHDNPDGLLETQNNPHGSFDNPEKPVTVTVKVTDTDTVKGTVTGTVTDTGTGTDTSSKDISPTAPVSGDTSVDDTSPVIDLKAKNDTKGRPTGKNPSQSELEVFEHWKMRMGKSNGAKLLGKRAKALKDRLKDGYEVDYIKKAIDGCARSPHHMGENKQGTVYDDLELICRTSNQMEWFADSVAKMTPQSNVQTMEDFKREGDAQTQRIIDSGLLDDIFERDAREARENGSI